MKKNMVNHLKELFENFDPSFQKVFEAEYPNLTGDEQIQFLKYLNIEAEKLGVLLKKLADESDAVAA